MNNWTPRNYCLYVTGFNKDIDRRTLKFEFSKFGNPEKIYLDNSGVFAKIFYGDKVSCDRAIKELNNSLLNWKVEFDQDNYKWTSRKSGASKMGSYGNYYEDDEEFSENFQYCNIHGHPLTVLEAESGDLYINLKDIRKTGFAIFRKDNFDSVLVDKRQIGKEFELHLLSEAKNFIIKNRAVIDEEQILQTIQRCKSKLLGADSINNSFGAGRSIAPLQDNNIKITSQAESTSTPPMDMQVTSQRPPKSLSSNFMPTNCQRNERPRRIVQEQHTTSMSQNNRSKHSFKDNEERNGFVNGLDTSTPKKEYKDQSLNVSSDSDSRNGSRKSNYNRQKRIPKFKEEIGALTFEIGQTYHVQVAYSEKENICWVQEKNEAVLEDMFVKINEIEADLKPIDPSDGQLVIALYEEAWNRGRVISVNPVTVHFIDFGNKCEVEAVKPLPDDFKKIPALAARITNNKVPFNELTEMQIRIKQQYDDGTYLVDVMDSKYQREGNTTKAIKEKPVQPVELKQQKPSQEKIYFEIPKPIGGLKNGDKVMVIDVDANKFLVRTRECAVKSKELTEYIKNLDKSALILTNVKVGQLVLCSKDGLVGLYRAVVTKKESGSVVTVKYVDFPGEDDLSVKSLRNVDEFLATEPSALILTPAHKDLVNMEEKVVEYIAKICQNKEKFTVALSNDDFDLQYDDGLLLSERIQDLTHPKPKQTTVNPTEEKPSTSDQSDQNKRKSVDKSCTPTEDKVLYEDMDWIKINSGTYTFMCYSLQDLNDITMISTTEDVITYLEEITDLEVPDDVPYKPQEFEMCLVSFKGPEEENASWYRAVVLEIEDEGYLVTFVDFGNKEVVKYQEIRKFPQKFKKIPILGVNCKCVGLPDTPEIVDHLKKLIPEGEQVEVIVKGLNDLIYEIEIPDIYKQLKSKGLY